jgi:thiamine-phosphate diphosphorylase
VRVIQYREKELQTREVLETAWRIRKLTKKAGALFIINDRVYLAAAVSADGVHLGQDDVPIHFARKILGRRAVIGVTVHNVGEAVAAEKAGADYLGVSPIFSTATKPDAGKPGGLALMREVKSKVKIPCIGIGGINEDNMLDVINAGADGIAMISAIITKDDVEGTVKRIRDKILSSRK